MSYKLNKTDGRLLVDSVDGQLDTTSSDLTLIGRNYLVLAKFQMKTLFQLLENFANSAQSLIPLEVNYGLIQQKTD